MQNKLHTDMNPDVPCEVFWPWEKVNLGSNECAMSLTYLFAGKSIHSKEVKNRSSWGF